MKIKDLTQNYLEYCNDGDLEKYSQSFPALFEHYFTYWGERNSFKATLAEEGVAASKTLVQNRLPYIEKRLLSRGLDSTNIEIVLFVGQGVTNGHAFQKDDSFIVWVPLELYKTEIEVDAFLTHEIIHALHYHTVPAYYFSSLDEKYDPLRQVAVEGLATFVTKKVMDLSVEEALWADFLSKEKSQLWIEECEKKRNEITDVIMSRDITKGRALFEANNDNSVLEFRGGYYLGYTLIDELSQEQNLSIADLLTLPRKDLESLLKEKLEVKK